LADVAEAVLQVVSSTKRRGAEIHATDLDAALSRLGWSVRTVALAPAPDGLAIETIGARSLAPSTVWMLRRLMADVGPVISHGSRSLPACAAASLVPSHRFVYRSIGDGISFAGSAARRARVALYLRRAGAVVALWPSAADALARYGVARDRVTVIPTGVPQARFPPTDGRRRAAARDELGLRADGPIVVCLGWLGPEKGVEVAIDAVAAQPELTLVIAGAGPLRADLEQHAAAVAPDRVRFLGAVADPTLVLTAADAFVLPSRHEGLPAVLVEAGFTGLPVVATDVGAVRTVLEHEVTGMVVPPGDAGALGRALAAVVTSGAGDELGRKLRAHCLTSFEIDVVAEAWNDLLARSPR
jgi:glycosyltransferase involved in cell wall biosynthesis